MSRPPASREPIVAAETSAAVHPFAGRDVASRNHGLRAPHEEEGAGQDDDGRGDHTVHDSNPYGCGLRRPQAIASFPMEFRVLTTVTGGAVRDWELMDALVDAVEAQRDVVGASIAGGDEPTVFVAVEAESVADAQRRAAAAVRAGLAHAGESQRTVVAGDTYDAEGTLRT